MRHAFKGLLLAVFAAASLAACNGCTAHELELEAAKRTHDVIAPQFRRYVEADAALSVAELEAEQQVLARWALIVTEDGHQVADELAVHEHVAPRFVRYVDADEGLDQAQKDRRKRHVEAWGIRLKGDR